MLALRAMLSFKHLINQLTLPSLSRQMSAIVRCFTVSVRRLWKFGRCFGFEFSQFDVVAKALKTSDPSLLIECKYYEKPIGPSNVVYFIRKAADLKLEIPNLIPIFYSFSGFTKPAIAKMDELQLPWSTYEFWSVLGT